MTLSQNIILSLCHNICRSVMRNVVVVNFVSDQVQANDQVYKNYRHQLDPIRTSLNRCT